MPPSLADTMQSVPTNCAASANVTPVAGYCVKLSPDGTGFTLFNHGGEVGSYPLAVYSDRRGEVTFWVLAPGTVAADATVYTAAILGPFAVEEFAAWLPSLNR